MDKNFLTPQIFLAILRAIQKTVEATGYLVANRIAEKFTKAASKTTPEDPSKSPAQIEETSIQPIRIPKEKYILPEIGNKLLMNIDFYFYSVYSKNEASSKH